MDREQFAKLNRIIASFDQLRARTRERFRSQPEKLGEMIIRLQAISNLSDGLIGLGCCCGAAWLGEIAADLGLTEEK